ncbi:MAG: TetR/AcrR family transcriptional regulator [Promicromonosporaceae bacterium]|nr:TetR/AcrR family transcriptional regulator [Promicromonosporaceae bacterium]
MARPREFDVEVAVDRAKELFWRHGFNGTSISDLTAELGVGPGSLYAAFGSKEGLYARALGRYCDEQAGDLLMALESSDDIRSTLREVLVGLVEMDLAEPRGCFLVNAATERDDDDTTIERIALNLRQVESALAGSLERAVATGGLGAEKDPAALARFFTTFIQGLRVMGQARSGRAFALSAVDTALAALD